MQIIPPTTNTMGSKALPVSPNAIKIRQVPISVAMVMPETGLELDPIRPTIRLETVTKKNPKTTMRSEEHTSELQSLMRISYAVFCLKKKKTQKQNNNKQEQSKNK